MNEYPPKLCINVDELATRLGISRPIAYQLVRRADFPKIAIGRRIITPIVELEKWLVINARDMSL